MDKVGKPRYANCWAMSDARLVRAPDPGIEQEDGRSGFCQIKRANFTGAAFQVNGKVPEGRGMWVTTRFQNTIVLLETSRTLCNLFGEEENVEYT